MNIAEQLEAHAHDELKHALIFRGKSTISENAVGDTEARADLG
jgi:hypothetical protein